MKMIVAIFNVGAWDSVSCIDLTVLTTLDIKAKCVCICIGAQWSCSATYDPARVPGFSGEADTATLNVPSPRCPAHVEISKTTGCM